MATPSGRQFPVVLRPLRPDDWKTILPWRNNPEIRDPALLYPYPVTEQMEKDWIERCSVAPHQNKVAFGLEEIVDRKLVGIAHISNMEWIHGTCQVGIFIGEQEHRKGYGWSSFQQLCQYAFSVLNFRKAICYVVASNTASMGMVQKVGFKPEGVLRNHVYLQGAYHDLNVMALFRSDLISQ